MALFSGGVALPEYPHIDSHDLWLPDFGLHSPISFEGPGAQFSPHPPDLPRLQLREGVGRWVKVNGK